ncbi:inner membrane-like protein [Elsinoe australis]|uniref:Inner membrane-like protein n=1 Tax=Elsinoe australis TaxID=40998 RepID=A0A4U7ATC7_9PEZI|nr:inner membrane-like protein [Elsinoe australis]
MSAPISPLRRHGLGVVQSAKPLSTLPKVLQYLTRPPLQQNVQRRGLLTTTLSDPGWLSNVPANFMTAVHTAGVPWLIALPASALIIRTSLVFPIVKRRRRNLTKLALLQPLIDARISQKVLKEQWTQSSKFKSGEFFGDKQRARRNIQWLKGTEERRLERYFSIPTARYMSKIIPILILITVSEGVRRLCGMSRGLLSILFGPFQPYIDRGVKWMVNTVAPNRDILSRAQETPLDPDQEHEVTKDMNVRQALYYWTTKNYNDFNTNSWTQASLREEGFPWCKDLTRPDPTHVLPVVFSATFFASIWFSPKEVKKGSFYSQSGPQASDNEKGAEQTPTTPEEKPKRTFWQKIMLGVSVLSIIPAWNMPVALVWYFIFNMGVSRLQTRHVNLMFPITVPPLACRTRARMMSSTDKLDLSPVLSKVRRR